MANPNNVEQFNAQVKRMSERLRGESATPTDTQTNENTLEDETNAIRTGTGGTAQAESPANHPQGRKKAPGGKKTSAMPRTSGTTAIESASLMRESVSNNAPSRELTSRDEGEQTQESNATPRSVGQEAQSALGMTSTIERAGAPDTTQAQDLPGREISVPSPTANTAGAVETPSSSLIAPEMIGRIMSGNKTRKP